MVTCFPRAEFKHLAKMIVVASLSVAGICALAARAHADDIDFSTYAAVAFSPSTGGYGYAWNCWSRGQAEQVALSHCTTDDTRIVGWVQGGWLVLAIGQDNSTYGTGWEYGDGATNTVAVERAVDECHSRGQKIRTVICLCSGDIDPVIYK
jgi:hypothetical protein